MSTESSSNPRKPHVITEPIVERDHDRRPPASAQRVRPRHIPQREARGPALHETAPVDVDKDGKQLRILCICIQIYIYIYGSGDSRVGIRMLWMRCMHARTASRSSGFWYVCGSRAARGCGTKTLSFRQSSSPSPLYCRHRGPHSMALMTTSDAPAGQEGAGGGCHRYAEVNGSV